MANTMGSKIIQWIKMNLTVVICGTLAVLSITLIALGFILPEAQASLAADKSTYDSLQQVAGKAANDRVVEDVRRKQADIRRNIQAFLATAAKSTPRTLLHPTVFPEAKERFNSSEFKAATDRKRQELIQLLNAREEPDSQDITDYGEELEKAKRREAQQSGEAPAGASPFAPFAPGAGGPTVMPGGGRPGGGLPGGGFPGGGLPGRGPYGAAAAPTAIPEGVTPEEWVKENAHAGASVKRAREIYCYASEQVLDPRSRLTDPFPVPELMWEAQISLWMQEDIIQVLARLNQEVASQLSDEDQWVGNLPVKRLLYIVSGSPVAPAVEGAAPMRGMTQTQDARSLSEPVPPAPGALFTQREVGETLDVIPLALGLVIDANYLLRVLDEISKIGFYTPLLVSYEAVAPEPSLQGSLYGPAPVIRVRIELEHCILREMQIGDKTYADLLPARIKDGTWVSPSRGGSEVTPGPSFGPPTRGEAFPGPGRGRFRDD